MTILLSMKLTFGYQCENMKMLSIPLYLYDCISVIYTRSTCIVYTILSLLLLKVVYKKSISGRIFKKSSLYLNRIYVTELHQRPVGTQPCVRNLGEPGTACLAVACRRRFLLSLAGLQIEKW